MPERMRRARKEPECFAFCTDLPSAAPISATERAALIKRLDNKPTKADWAAYKRAPSVVAAASNQDRQAVN